jgi:hypothetical protein
MTTRNICVAAKGEINSTNDPTLGTDTPTEVNFFTVFGHPDPQDDPSTPVTGWPFRRGDANADGSADIADPIAIVFRLFMGGSLPCARSADANDDGLLGISDPIFLLESIFLGGTAPAEPFAACGLDDVPDALGCDSFPPCR